MCLPESLQTDYMITDPVMPVSDVSDTSHIICDTLPDDWGLCMKETVKVTQWILVCLCAYVMNVGCHLS